MNGMSGHLPRKKITFEMKYFTIGSENKIAVKSSRNVARETDRVFATEVGIVDFAGNSKRLVEIWKLERARWRPGRTPSRSRRTPRVSSGTNPQVRRTRQHRWWRRLPDAGPQGPRVALAEGKAGKTRPRPAKKATAGEV
jgi:hypothetical protein